MSTSSINFVCVKNEFDFVDSLFRYLKDKFQEATFIKNDDCILYFDNNDSYLKFYESVEDDTIYLKELDNIQIERIVENAKKLSYSYFYFCYKGDFVSPFIKEIISFINYNYNSYNVDKAFFREEETLNLYSVNYFHNNYSKNNDFWIKKDFNQKYSTIYK